MNDIPVLPGNGKAATPGEPLLHNLPQVIAQRTGLSESDMRRISAVQKQLGLGFIEAALRLNLISQADLDVAMGADARQAQVSAPHAKPSSELLSAHDPYEPYCEAIRSLRTELALRAEGEACNVIAVVSPDRGEGRSRLAAELAIAFAQLGQDTLLVDADLRQSRQHELFGADNDAGLAQALTDGRTPRVQGVSGLPSLSLLPAGSRPPNPLELLSDSAFENVMSGWRRRHQHVLIDTPSIRSCADAIAIAAQARRVLLVSRRHVSSYEASRELVRKLQSTRAQIVGSVIQSF